MAATETMPCPQCKTPHEKGDYHRQQDPTKPGVFSGPDDVRCPCGLVLRHTVPIFLTDAYGWHWRVIPPAETYTRAPDRAPNALPKKQ